MAITWNLRGRLMHWETPVVMGILNATPDSFHAASRVSLTEVVDRAGRMLDEGAALLDIGGMSTRPGAVGISLDAELDRLLPVVEALHAAYPDAVLSVDSYRAQVAKAAVQAGASLVNDVSAGLLDPDMLATVASLHVPYIAMHMQGTPATMQEAPHYADVRGEVLRFLSERISAARAAGIADVAIDPGFGFGKTQTHNYTLLGGLGSFTRFDVPVLIGVSRKRMVSGPLGTTAAEALNGSTVLHTIALMNGASILRVHDVRPAVEAVLLVQELRSAQA
jgi:dihydropteroate synthase